MPQPLTDSQQWAQAVVNSANHLIIATDPTGTVAWFNKAAERALGYSADEIVGKQSPSLWHEEREVVQRAAELSEELARTVEPGFDVFVLKSRLGGPETREWTFVRKDGHRFPVRLTVSCIRTQPTKIIGYLGVIEDITEQKAAREKLDDARAFLNLMNANNPDYVFVKDEQCAIIQANPAFLSLYPEHKRDKIIGYTTVEDYPDDEAEAFLAADRKAFAEGSSETIERITFPNGEVRLLDTRKVRFTNAKGDPFILGIARDITEREQLITQLRQSNEELEEFAYRTSHDLRSPLVSSISLLGVVRKSLESNHLERAYQGIGHIESSLKKLEELVKDILTLTQAKGDKEADGAVDLCELVQTAIDNVSHLEGFARLRIQRDLSHSGPVVLQRRRLQLIVENLVSNAVKYQDPAQAKPFVRITTKTDGTVLELAVADNGLGVPEEHRPNLFAMFKRFHSRVSFGSGLGLYMVKKSAAVLGGTISFEDPGVGALFRLRVPYQHPSPQGGQEV